MKTSYLIPLTTDRFPKGQVFTYVHFTTKVNKNEALLKAVNRMADSGKIAKPARGKCQIHNQKY